MDDWHQDDWAGEPDGAPKHSRDASFDGSSASGADTVGGGDADGARRAGPEPTLGADVGSFAGAGAGLWARGGRRSGPIGGVLTPVADALASVEGIEALGDEDLAAAVVDCQRLRSRLDALAAELTSRWDGRALWRSDGSKAAGARLERDAGISRTSANVAVATARGVRSMPLVATTWHEGRISTDHVTRLTRACTPERAGAFGRAEADLVRAAETLDWAGFERAVALFETAADDERFDPTDPDDVAAHERRQRAKLRGRIRAYDDGVKLEAFLDRVGGAMFATIWDRIDHDLWLEDCARAKALYGDGFTPDQLGRTSDQRRADALVEMARRAGACPDGAVVPKPLISVIVSHDEMTGPIRHTFNGTVLSRFDVARLLTEADVESILFDDTTHQPVTVTSQARFFTGALRRAIEVRDRVCCHPTCQVEAEYCHIDHIVEVTAGGLTTVANGRLLCPAHNRQRPGRRPPTGAPPGDRSNRGSHRGGTGPDDQDGDPDQRHAA